MQELKGRTAVITGAASGIGLELARTFGAAGMNLVLADIEQPALADAESSLTEAGYEVLSEVVDVRKLEDLQRLEAAARQRFGEVHVLCNNAGVAGGGPVAEPGDLEAWRWTIDINLWGVIYGCKVFLPAMIEHGEPCHVVNTASMAGLQSAPMMGAYNISKYGVVALSETLTREMQQAQTSVGVSVLCPAFVSTGIADSHRNMPADVAATLPDSGLENEGMRAVMQELVRQGISTELVADAVIDAVKNDRFWILTHEETKPGILMKADDIVNGVNPALGFGLTD